MKTPSRIRSVRRPRRSTLPIPHLTALLSLLLLLGACSALEEGPGPFEGPESDRMRVEVRSDGVATDDLVIYVATDTGVRRRLGTLDTSGDGNFVFDPPSLPAGYRLLAQDGARLVAASDPFTLTAPATIHWDLNGNSVRLRPR